LVALNVSLDHGLLSAEQKGARLSSVRLISPGCVCL
jgi:hypothetical protein